MKKTVRIGTRGSQLALWQANYIEHELTRLNPDVEFERVIIKTTGDRDQKSSLSQIGGMGVFTKTIEDELMAENIDIAVHSLKDLPSAMTPGLVLGAVPARGPVEDVLVTVDGVSLEQLPSNSVIATGSIRRQSQLLGLRNDIQLADLRGNIHTRLEKLHSEGLSGIIMARAAIIRLKLGSVKYSVFSTTEMVPAIGQGAIGVQIRENDTLIKSLVGKLNDNNTLHAVTAERALLRTLDSGCQFPVGGHAIMNDQGQLEMVAFVGSTDGIKVLRASGSAAPKAAEKLGESLANELLTRGAGDILRALS